MPLYDYECQVCDLISDRIVHVDERHEQTCSVCGNALHKLVTGAGRYIPFKKGWYEHIDKKPIYVETMQQLKKECKKRNVTSVYAEDSI